MNKPSISIVGVCLLLFGVLCSARSEAAEGDGAWGITAASGTVQTITGGSPLTYSIYYAGNPAGSLTSYVTVAVGWSGNTYRLYGTSSIDVASKGKPITLTGKTGDTGYYRTTSAKEPWVKTAPTEETLTDGSDYAYSIAFAGNPAGSLTSFVTLQVGWSGSQIRIYGDSSLIVSSKNQPIKLVSLKTGDTGTFQAIKPAPALTLSSAWRYSLTGSAQTLMDGSQLTYRIKYDGAAGTYVTVNSAWDATDWRIYSGTSLDVSSYGQPITVKSIRTGDTGTYTVVGSTGRSEDVNGDGAVTVIDAIQVLRAAVGLTP